MIELQRRPLSIEEHRKQPEEEDSGKEAGSRFSGRVDL